MGYSTDFHGSFKLNKPLSNEHKEYLERFSTIRHMKRDGDKIKKYLPDPFREEVDLPVGEDGCFYVGEDDGNFGQSRDVSIVNYNLPPGECPGLWCSWHPYDNGTIGWTGDEKFYDYVKWLEFIIENFLKPWGYVLNGEVEYRGEDWEDTGWISVKDNMVRS